MAECLVPCPNPACDQQDVPYVVLEKPEGLEWRARCGYCHMSGPQHHDSDTAARLWNALPRYAVCRHDWELTGAPGSYDTIKPPFFHRCRKCGQTKDRNP